jgi:hypothetical protein
MPAPTDDVELFIEGAAKYCGALNHGGKVDQERACSFILQKYRNGSLGHHTFDDCSPEALHEFFDDLYGKGVERRRIVQAAQGTKQLPYIPPEWKPEPRWSATAQAASGRIVKVGTETSPDTEK